MTFSGISWKIELICVVGFDLTSYPVIQDMQLEIYHLASTTFLFPFSAKLSWLTLLDSVILDTEKHIPVVFKQGFPSVPDNNGFPQMAF